MTEERIKAVIKTWQGNKHVCIHILSKCHGMDAMEAERAYYRHMDITPEQISKTADKIIETRAIC